MKVESSFYLTSEAARALNVCPLTIRNWEKTGMITAGRSQAGYRIFSDVEIARVRAEREAQAAE